MTDRELNITLREMARSVGLCDEWYGQWKDDSTIDECLMRYIKGFDFAVKNDWPSLEFIRKNFRKEDLHRHNIYIDEEVDIPFGTNGYYIFLGKCTGRLSFKEYKAATVYVRHESDITVSSFGGSRILIQCFENGDAQCVRDKYSKIKKIGRRA